MVLTNSHYCFFRMTKLMKYKTSKAHAFSKFSNFLYQWYFFNEKLCQLNLWKCHIYFINFYDSSSCMTVLRNYQRILTVLEINHVFFLSKMTWFSWFIMELEYQMCPEPANIFPLESTFTCSCTVQKMWIGNYKKESHS